MLFEKIMKYDAVYANRPSFHRIFVYSLNQNCISMTRVVDGLAIDFR
jgi:hypothetical protein